MPANILNLSEYTVVRIEESAHDYHIAAEVAKPPRACPECAGTNLIGHGRYQQVVRDLPMHGKRVGIYVDTRRWRCAACGKTFMEALPSVDDKRAMTRRLERWIGEQSMRRTFASLAEDVGIDEKTVRNIFRDYVNEMEAQFRFETPTWMGLDEIHLIRPRCVISNLRNNTVVNLLPSRDKKTVANYLYSLDHREDVQYVAMDMWTPYRDAVQAVLPGATIVIDKFHVVRMANDAMERARKGLREKLLPKQRRGLMHDRFVLLKRERDLTAQEQLLMDGWTANYPELGAAYRLKEAFYGVYETAKTVSDAVHQYTVWNQSVPHDMHSYFSDLIRAWTNWQPYIVNYFAHPVTNAYTESLNNLIRVMDRLGRGYSFEALRAKVLFTEGLHKRKAPVPKFQRRRDMEMMMVGGSWEEPAGSTDSRERNYGTDIALLTEMLASGKL